MASTLSAVCFVRCPKCLRVLAEFPDIPLFKCYGCDAILKAKVHSDNCSSENGIAIYLKQISNASDEPKKLEQEEAKRSEDSKSNGEKNSKELEYSGNVMKILSVSESNGGSRTEKINSAVYELNGIDERIVEPISESRRSSNQIVPEANDSLNSNYKIEQSAESLEIDIKNQEGNEDHKNGIGFRWKTRSSDIYDRSFSLSDKLKQVHVTQKQFAVSRRTRSSNGYDRSFSSSAEHLQHHHPQSNIALSRRTRSRKAMDSADSIEAEGKDNNTKSNANSEEQPEKHYSKFSNQSSGNGVRTKDQNTFSSENRKISSITQSKDAEHDDQVKILEKVDELKIELHRMFSNKSDGKEASNFSIKVTHFNGKIESNDDRSSRFGLSRQSSSSSCLICGSSGMCCHNRNRRVSQETQFRHCRPVSGGAPFVICYRCFKLLQLPVDFLVSTKRIHKLRCGSCSEILVYSFRPRSRAAVNKRS